MVRLGNRIDFPGVSGEKAEYEKVEFSRTQFAQYPQRRLTIHGIS
jgi:hypothetical protein